jgi:hypothetical protein
LRGEGESKGAAGVWLLLLLCSPIIIAPLHYSCMIITVDGSPVLKDCSPVDSKVSWCSSEERRTPTPFLCVIKRKGCV